MKKILSRFTGYTPTDCDCKLCLHYQGRGKSCLLETCCCEEEKKEAPQKIAATPTVASQAQPWALP